MLSKEVVSYAGGLPLALKVLGSFLRDKDTSEWKNALARLREIPNSEVVEKLKISYDGLGPMEKELFLDIACFFRGQTKHEAMVILDACGFYPTIGVKVLIEKALITLSKEKRFEMHDLIEEMGHYIVRGENPQNPEKHSRIWDKDVLNIIAVDSMKENDIIEALNIPFYNHGECLPSLPKVLANMKELRLIWFFGYEATSFPRNFQPMKLCYLGLVNCSLKQLWKGYKLLPKLKVLNLSSSSNLVTTPDLTGLPCLERMEMHPSIGYHEGLTFVDMEVCRSLEKFPPIIRMKKLETLLFCGCLKLCKFPDIQTNMDSLVELSLRETGIEVVPASIGRYCTNLLSLDLRYCRNLQSIEGNFHRLRHLKGFYFDFNDQTKIPAEGLFDVDCCLQMLSLHGTSLKKFHQVMVSIKILSFSRSLVRLNLGACNLVDGEISSVLWKEFSNLQALDLSENKFSRLDSSLSQLPRLKYLDLSCCKDLVELPDLPSSLAILKAYGCDKLQIVDLPTNLKWLWKLVVFTESSTTLVDVKKVVQSMLQGNAVEDYFLSLHFYGTKMSTKRETFVLELPPKWYNEYSGFLIYATEGYPVYGDGITINDEDDVLEVATSDEDEVSKEVKRMCYISFGSLRHTTWWNSTHTKISLSMPGAYLHVELVPRRSKAERPKDATNLSEFWDEDANNGPHVCNNIVDHLYSALVQQGINTLKDAQTLPWGKPIGPLLFKAIEESQIAVIVYSQTYVDSSWCMQELEHNHKGVAWW
ncbi:hypothetical protein OSB04_018694 [Centaurea solstitialis]|uniref:TIR domain-containing protein n=1 Tax=Centaurea solstitialis TaxID=347529 RepID=A0AA38T700_9ASTR|nr:hypothetical protein OSB04_018694 [Centaurea solstitialis]